VLTVVPINGLLAFPMPKSTKERFINALTTCKSGVWCFRTCFDSDRSAVDGLNHFKSEMSAADQFQLDLPKRKLLSHFRGVCLIPDSMASHHKFSSWYSMMEFPVSNSLSEGDAHIICQLFIDFYYRTNLPLWHEQRHEKPSVFARSTMPMFGYDIGAALTDEEKHLHRVGICSYHVQRIPRNSTLGFDQARTFPYLSICSPSSPELPPLSGEEITEQTHSYSLIRYSR
jgi:hypothetical protein